MDYTSITKTEEITLRELRKALDEGPLMGLVLSRDENGKIDPDRTKRLGRQDFFWKSLKKNYTEEWIESFNELIESFSIGYLPDMHTYKEEYVEIVWGRECPFYHIKKRQIDFCLEQKRRQKMSQMKSYLWGAFWSIIGSEILKYILLQFNIFE